MGKLVECICWNGNDAYSVHLTLKELVAERTRLRGEAFKIIKEHADDPNFQHLMYYRDVRNEEDEIERAYLYSSMIPFTDEMLYKAVDGLTQKGFYGVVHRHE